MEWRRRSRNTFARGRLGFGRRYADNLPPLVNRALDVIVAYYEESERVAANGSSEARLERRRDALRSTLARLEEL